MSSDHKTTDTTYGTDVTVPIPTYIGAGRAISAVRVTSASIPICTYNILSGQNDTLDYTIDGTPGQLVISPGYYSSASLAAIISFGGVLSVVIDGTLNFKTTVSPVAGAAMTISATHVNAPSILGMLGFAKDSYTGGATYISEGMCTVIKDRYIMITCDECKGKRSNINSTSLKEWHDGILAYLPLRNSVTEVAVYDRHEMLTYQPIVKNSSTLTFHLRREMFDIFGPATVDWSMDVEFLIG